MSARLEQIKAELKTVRRDIQKLTRKLKPFEDAEKALCTEYAVLKYGIAVGDRVKSVQRWNVGETGVVVSVEAAGLFHPSYKVLFGGKKDATLFCLPKSLERIG